VSISSVGAGALGVTAIILLYPRLPTARIVGSDIAHAVPLTWSPASATGYWARSIGICWARCWPARYRGSSSAVIFRCACPTRSCVSRSQRHCSSSPASSRCSGRKLIADREYRSAKKHKPTASLLPYLTRKAGRKIDSAPQSDQQGADLPRTGRRFRLAGRQQGRRVAALPEKRGPRAITQEAAATHSR
jgi:hypothetical protein